MTEPVSTDLHECRQCPTGHYERRNVAHTTRHRGQLVVIDEVPADVCTVCGDTLYPPETARRLDRLRDALEEGTLQPADEAAVYHLAQVATASPAPAPR